MIHYTCDRCKREIDTTQELRYVIKIETQAAACDALNDIDGIDDEIDQLAELHEALEGIADDDLQVPDYDCDCQASNVGGRYDVCPECYQLFSKNPLGRDALLSLGFSNN